MFFRGDNYMGSQARHISIPRRSSGASQEGRNSRIITCDLRHSNTVYIIIINIVNIPINIAVINIAIINIAIINIAIDNIVIINVINNIYLVTPHPPSSHNISLGTPPLQP